MAKDEVKWGSILSYILIFLNSIYGLVVMPFVLDMIGSSEYGIYKTIAAMTSTISVMELGIGGTMQKYIAQFIVQKDYERMYNYTAMSVIQAVILSCLMGIIGFFAFFSLDSVYGETFTSQELFRAKQIYVVLILYVVFHIFENVLFGIISGHNKFTFSNGMKIAVLGIRVLLYFIVLPIFKTSMAIVLIYLIMEIVVILLEYGYVRFKLKHKIKLYKWDRPLFKESLVYTILLFVQTLIVQFNGNIDSIVIGAVIGTSAVTLYSFALQIFNMYEQCSTSISGVILPTVTRIIHNGATPRDLENMIIKYGRVQWMIMGAALGGFISLGEEFFSCWLGAGFEDCYYLSLILMIPVSFSMVVNSGLAILKVKNLLKFRTISLAYATVLNLIITVVGTKIWGYWAAAIGTTVSVVISSIISLNIYYYVKLKINILRVYYHILFKITICVAIPSIVCLILNRYIFGGWIEFIIKAAVFVCMYGILLLLSGNLSVKRLFKNEVK